MDSDEGTRRKKRNRAGGSEKVFEVKLTPQAERAYRHLDATTRARVDKGSACEAGLRKQP